jgi:hypothetical protein
MHLNCYQLGQPFQLLSSSTASKTCIHPTSALHRTLLHLTSFRISAKGCRQDMR